MQPIDWARKALWFAGLPENSPRLEKLTKVIEDAMTAQREADAKMAEWYPTYTGPKMESLAWCIRNGPLGGSDGPPT